mgnify:CR=1 FL=1
MQRTKSKLLSILLSLVMLLSLLPTTALAATYNDVKVNGVSLGDGEYLTSNAATAASISSTEPTTYVAWYKNGVLTLNNFTGKSNSGIVLQGAPAADLIIKLIGNNTITPYDTGIQGNSAAGSITITADSGSNGNLTIDMTNSMRPVFGINGTANSVTITGSANVTINATTTATNQESYGIKSDKAVSILENASVSITCKTPNSTSRSDSCKGIFSGSGVTIETDGQITIDVSAAGNEAYSYGILSMSALNLTKVGGMTVRWKKASMQGAPLLPSSASFDPNAYDTNVDETTCIATYMPKGSATTPITGELPVTIIAPVKGGTPQSAIAAATQYTGTIAWEGNPTTFAANTAYTAKVELTANSGYQFASDVNPTVTDATISEKSVSADGKTLTFKATFPETDSKTLKGIDIITNPALTLAVPTAAPNATATNERSLAVTGVYDDGSGGPVAVNWEIMTTPTPKGVSLDGSTLKVTNEAEAGTFMIKATSAEGYTDAETVTITKDTPVESAIVLTAPTPATVAVPKSDTPNEIALPTAAVYDQYGKPMTGTFSITYESVGTTPTGVTLATGAGKIKVDRTAQAGEVKVIAKLGTTLTSDPVTYTITRETSKVTSVRVNAPEYLMDVPKVTEPGTPSQANQQFKAAKVLDQYGQEMTGQTVTWSVADNAGNSVTGVSIDDTGKLTVTNEAPAITVYVTATCSGIVSNKSKVTINKEPTKATLVEIFNQAEEDPETSLLIPAATFTNSEAYTAKVYDQYGKETGEMVFWNLDKTYTGVELDTVTSSGNAILKVENTATPGTIQLIANCSTSGSTASKTLDITLVDKTPASVTAVPAAQTGLFYNGTDQALVTAGTASGGTMQYSLDGTTWSTAVPTGKNVGAYTVQYKVVGDATHTDTAPQTCQMVMISPKFLTMDNLTPTGSTSKVYDGTTVSSITVGVKAGVLYGSDTLTITGTAVYNSANANEANTITFTPDAITTGNYRLAGTQVLTITGASITPRDLTVTPNAGQSKKFGAEDPTLHSTNSGRVPGQIPDFSGALSRAEGEDVGQYDITLGTLALIDHFSSGFKASNYTLKMVSPAVKFEITKADAPAAPTGLKGYKDSALSTVTLPTGWSWVDSTLKMNTIGDQTFKANYAGDTNHQAGTNVDVTVKVVRRSSGSGGGSYYAPVVPDMPMVYWGCTGDAVKTLQEKLNAKGFNSGNVDGIFGAKTYAAVTAFQKANSLGVDGIVGKLTWAKLYDATPVNVTPVTTQPMLRTGSRGDAVRKLQELLNAKGYTCGSVDGIFGSKTYAAVLAFQKANGLAADGIVGSLTWAKLG